MKARSNGLSAALCAAGIVALIGVSGCSSSSSSGGGGDAFASGVAVKGRVVDGMVTVFELRSTGALGRVLGVGTSNASGEFSVPIPAAEFTGWAVACVMSGMFVDEATGVQMPITADAPLYGFVDVQVSSVDFAITPLTTIAFSLMQFFAHDPEATIDDSIENALTATENFFGLANVDVDLPADLTAGTVAAGPQADNAIVIAGISKLAETAAVPTMVMLQALAEDAGDGSFDGQFFDEDVPLGAGTLSPTAGTTDLAAAIVDFLGSPENASGLTDADTLVDDDLAASLGEFDKPIQIQRLVNGFGSSGDIVDATLEALEVPPSPQIEIEAQIVAITSQDAREIGFEIPSGLTLGLHDLVLTDLDTGLTARLRDAIEVSDPKAAPTVSEISPAKGPLTGGSFLQIRGTNFGPNTQVEVGGILSQRLAQDFPRWMVVATPAGAEGSVDVTVRNPGSEVVVPDGFEYVSGDARINPSVPSPLTTIVFGAFRNFADATTGLTAQAFFGRSTFISFDRGDFTLTDFTATETAPAVALRQRSGQTFQSNESLAKAFLLSDATNGISDFIRGFTNEENGVSMGATAFGPACFFPEPSNVAFDAAVGKYWVNGFEANIGLSTLRQKAGWLELDANLSGSASFMTHDRDYTGSSFGLDFEKWRITYNLSATGAFQGSRTIDDTTDNLSGHFNAGADFGFLLNTSTTGTISYYLLTRIEHGVESGGFGGWIGGYLAQEIADDGGGGDESAFESGSYRGLIATTPQGSGRLAFNRATLVTPSNTDGCFSEYVGAVNLDVSPSGRMFSDDNLVGYLSSYSGLLFVTGAFPNECVQNAGTDLSMAIGGAVYRESRKSFLSLEPDRKQVSIEAKLHEVGTTHRQELGTDFFDVTMNASTPPTVMSVVFPLAGTIPQLEAATITGTHKSTVRDESGTVTTIQGDPPPFGVQVGYSFIDDTLDFFATEITQAGGRFDGADMPRWIGSGTLGNDGQVAVVRSSDEFLGDGLTFLVADRGLDITEPNYDMKAVGLGLIPNSGGLSGVISLRTDLGFGGNGTVTSTLLHHTLWEDGLFTTGVAAGLGLNTAPIGQRIRMNIPTAGGPDQEWETIFTPDGNTFVGIEDTPGEDIAQLVLGIRPTTSGSFVDDDRAVITLELNPAISRGTTLQLQLKPRVGSLLSGEIFTSRRDGAHKVLPGQSFVSTTATDVGPGEARVPIVGQTPVLSFFFSDRDDAIGQEDLTISLTPRITYSFDF